MVRLPDKSPEVGVKRLVQKMGSVPRDQGGWIPITSEYLSSNVVRSLSINARKVLDMLKVEHISHAGVHNGKLITTHRQLIEAGVTAEFVADAVEELVFKGLIKCRRGRAGDGTPHPNIYTLTFAWQYDGTAPTNEWRRKSDEQIKQWKEQRKINATKRKKKHGAKKKRHQGITYRAR